MSGLTLIQFLLSLGFLFLAMAAIAAGSLNFPAAVGFLFFALPCLFFGLLMRKLSK